MTIVVMAMLLSAKVVTFASEAKAALDGPAASSPAAPPKVAAAKSGGANPVAAVGIAPGGSGKTTAAVEVDATERALLQELRQRSEQLDAREREINDRKTVIEAAEAKLETRIDRLASLQSSLEELDGARKQRQSANWSGLVKVYEAMKPRDAAAIFDVLDIHVLLEVLDRMNERKAAAVLAAMQPERARMATQMLAQMRTRQDVPEPQQVSSNNK